MTDRLWVLGAADPEMEMIEALLRECGERVAYAADPDRVLWGDPGTVGAPVPRVTSGDEYRANQAIAPVRGSHGQCTILATATDGVWVGDGCEVIYLVECGVDAPGYTTPDWEDDDVRVRIVRIDHHRPGDPGYGRPPSEFLAASSIGQVIAELARLGRLPSTWQGQYAGRNPSLGDIEQGRVIISEHEATHMTSFGVYYSCGWGLVIPADFALTAAADHCPAAAYRGECPGVDPDLLAKVTDFTGERK